MRIGAIFGPIHEMSRHAIHTSEILEAAIDTIQEMHHSRIAIQKRLLDDLGETYREQAKDYAQFQISLLKCLKLRSDSNQERLKNEINLVRNACWAVFIIILCGSSRAAGIQQPRSPGQQCHEVHRAADHGLPPGHLHLGTSSLPP